MPPVLAPPVFEPPPMPPVLAPPVFEPPPVPPVLVPPVFEPPPMPPVLVPPALVPPAPAVGLPAAPAAPAEPPAALEESFSSVEQAAKAVPTAQITNTIALIEYLLALYPMGAKDTPAGDFEGKEFLLVYDFMVAAGVRASMRSCSRHSERSNPSGSW
jgi:hypothetical protein